MVVVIMVIVWAVMREDMIEDIKRANMEAVEMAMIHMEAINMEMTVTGIGLYLKLRCYVTKILNNNKQL